jgi:hypothetical protein
MLILGSVDVRGAGRSIFVKTGDTALIKGARSSLGCPELDFKSWCLPAKQIQ